MSISQLKNSYTYSLDTGSQEAVPQIFPSQNTLNDYTTLLSTKDTRVESLSDGVAMFSGGTIDGVVDPTGPGVPGGSNRAITKAYVDTSVNNISVPLNSLQKSSGSTFLGSNGLVYVEGELGLKVLDQIIYASNAGLITSCGILNTSAIVYDNQSGSTRSYLNASNMTTVTLTTSTSSNSLTADNVINTSFTRVSNATGIIQDILPNPIDVIAAMPNAGIGSAFDFVYRYIGTEPSILLYGRIIQRGNFLVYNTPVEVVTVPTNNIYKFRGVVSSLSPPLVDYYVLGQQPIEGLNQQITPLGLKTDDFRSYLNVLNNTNIIYPVAQSIIDSTGATTYTVGNLKGLLITRTSLTASATDSLPTGLASSFPIGSGLVSFSVQNATNFNLVVGSGVEANWTFGPGSRTIASSSVGNFDIYVDTTSDSYILYSKGTTSMNG